MTIGGNGGGTTKTGVRLPGVWVDVKLGFNGVINVVEVELEVEDEVLPVPVAVGFAWDVARSDARPATGVVLFGATAVDFVAGVEVGVLSLTSAGTRRLALGLPNPVTRPYVADDEDPLEPLVGWLKSELDN